MGKKTNLSEQEIAALAAGIPLENLTNATPAETSNDTTAEVENTDIDASSEQDVPVVPAPTAEVEAATPENKTSADSVVALLKSQLAEANQNLLNASIELNDLKKANASLNALVTPMRGIVEKSIGNMQIALGGSATPLDARDTASLLAEHDTLRKSFENKFKAGGVAATSSVQTVTENVTQLAKADSLFKARLNATITTKSKGA